MRKIVDKYRKLIILLLAIILLFTGVAVKNHMISSVSTSQPWKRWSANGDRYGYVSVYYPENEGITDNEIRSFRNSLNTAVGDTGIETLEGARPYIDSYSTSGTAEVYGTRNRVTSKVNVTAVGGEYFYMHPSVLLTGDYISETDLMEDRVVIDENTAWFLYGSTDIVGKSLMIDGNSYYIAGVVRPHDSGAAKKTYGTRNRIYMSYKAYSELYDTAKITCYEVIYPDMITNYAYNKVREVIGLSDKSESVTENAAEEENSVKVINMSTRFDTGSIWKVLCSYGERSAHTDGIIYPFWENECRRIEDLLVLVMLWCILWIVVVAVIVIPYVIVVVRYIDKIVHGLRCTR